MYLDNKKLEDEHTVNDYNIQNESALMLHLTDDMDVQLFVNILTGKIFILHVHMWDTIAKVKKKIQDREGIPPDQQRLVYDGTWWEDDRRTLSDCGYHYNDDEAVRLLLRIRGGVPGVGDSSPSIFFC